jgi:hypothetical protein
MPVYRLVANGKPTNLTPAPGHPAIVDTPNDLPEGPVVIVGTTAKLAWGSPEAFKATALIVDEAYQLPDWGYAHVAGLAERHLLVGDPGQIAPVSKFSVPHPGGAGLAAPRALLNRRAHLVTTVELTATRRLGPRTTRFVQTAFYPNLPFASIRPPMRLDGADGAWRAAGEHELVLMTSTNPYTDAVRLVHDAIGLTVTDTRGSKTVTAGDVGVIVAHRHQAVAVRSLLDPQLASQVRVDTANRWQGLETDLAVVVHPLAGKSDPTRFGLDTGRLCVSLSRHKVAAVVIIPPDLHHMIGGSVPISRTYDDGDGPQWTGVAANRVLLQTVPRV